MTKRIIKQVTRKQNDGYEYYEIRSTGPASLYGDNLSSEEYENAHLDHIISDYEEDGYEVLSAECEYRNKYVYMTFYARRKK